MGACSIPPAQQWQKPRLPASVAFLGWTEETYNQFPRVGLLDPFMSGSPKRFKCGYIYQNCKYLECKFWGSQTRVKEGLIVTPYLVVLQEAYLRSSQMNS